MLDGLVQAIEPTKAKLCKCVQHCRVGCLYDRTLGNCRKSAAAALPVFQSASLQLPSDLQTLRTCLPYKLSKRSGVSESDLPSVEVHPICGSERPKWRRLYPQENYLSGKARCCLVV